MSTEPNAIITRASPWPVAEALARFQALLVARGLHLFSVVDHSGEAQAAGLALRDTKLVIFGSPRAGTPVMVAAPLSALDLPLKLLIWADEPGTRVSYLDPRALGARHGLTDELTAKLAGIETLVDALLAGK